MAPISPDTSHTGRHEWNTFENYGHINDRRLTEHRFVDHSEVTFEEITFEGDLFISMEAIVYCLKDVILEVTKVFETKRMGPGGGRLYVRAFSYRYNAWIKGKHNILRYDNSHDLDEYHGHRFNPDTGELLTRRTMPRDEFPLFAEVLDELQEIVKSRNP